MTVFNPREIIAKYSNKKITVTGRDEILVAAILLVHEELERIRKILEK